MSSTVDVAANSRCSQPSLVSVAGFAIGLLLAITTLAMVPEAQAQTESAVSGEAIDATPTAKYAARLEQALERDLQRPTPTISPVDADWLAQRSEQILIKPEHQSAGLLDQIRTLLQRWLRRNVDDNDWLRSLVEQLRISEQLANILFWSMSALIVALALWIVVRELRLLKSSHFSRRQRGRGFEHESDNATTQWPPPLDDLPLAQRLPMLLQALAGRLQAGGWLTTLPGRSNAHYSAELRRRQFVEAPAFRRIQQQVDAQIYGGSAASAVQLREFVKVAERIHRQAKPADE